MGVKNILIFLIFTSVFLYSNENFIEYIKGDLEITLSKDRQYKDNIFIEGMEKESVGGVRLYINKEGIATILERKAKIKEREDYSFENTVFTVEYEVKSFQLDEKIFEKIEKENYKDHSIFDTFEISYIKIKGKKYKLLGIQKINLDNIVKEVKEKYIENIYVSSINGNTVVVNDDGIITILEYDKEKYIQFDRFIEIKPKNLMFPYKFYDLDIADEKLVTVFIESGDSFIDKKILKFINENGENYVLFESSNCGELMKITGQFNRCNILRESKIKSPKKTFKVNKKELLEVKDLLEESRIKELDNYIISLEKRY